MGNGIGRHKRREGGDVSGSWGFQAPEDVTYSITSNGRAVIKRKDFMHAHRLIDAEKVDNLVLITRGPIVPAISRLTREQAVAFMVLGQAMESSAGDPSRAGQLKNEFFYDPFFVGDKAEHAHRFYGILQSNPDMGCYLLNTGGIGEGDSYEKIQLASTLGILDSLLRGGLTEWEDSAFGLQVPKAVRTVSRHYLHPEKFLNSQVFRQYEP